MKTQTWLDIELQQKKNTDTSFYGTTAITIIKWHITEFQELLKFSRQ